MKQIQTAKVVLALAGIVVFLVGIQSGQDVVRWAGIALVAAAWFLRFAGRDRANRQQPHSPSEDQ